MILKICIQSQINLENSQQIRNYHLKISLFSIRVPTTTQECPRQQFSWIRRHCCESKNVVERFTSKHSTNWHNIKAMICRQDLYEDKMLKYIIFLRLEKELAFSSRDERSLGRMEPHSGWSSEDGLHGYCEQKPNQI